MSTEPFDLAVIGAGPAGLSALAEAARLGCGRMLLIDESGRAGGTIGQAHAVRNIPFVEDHAPGARVARQLEAFCLRTGVPVTKASVHELRELDGGVELKARDGRRWKAARVVVATGAKPRHPKIPGLPADFGHPWLDCCRTVMREPLSCTVAVIGAGDVALDQSRRLRALGASVTVLCRSERPRAPAWLQRSALDEGVEVLVRCELERAEDAGSAAALHLRHDGSARVLRVERVLAAIGRAPALPEGVRSLDPRLCRIVGDAVGRASSHVVAALGDGCTAASELLKGGLR